MRKHSISQMCISVAILLFSLMCVVPMIIVISASFSSENALIYNGYKLFPQDFNTSAYDKLIGGNGRFFTSYKITLFVTFIGTCTAVLITFMAAYALSNRQVRCRNGLAMFFFVPMVFSAGMVPWYIICNKLGLRNNILALIIPNLLFSPFNMFLTRNFLNGIPESLAESARIDGANDVFIAFKIYLPLSSPVLAAIGLFYGLDYWNDWWNAIMLVEKSDLFPIQYMLMRIQSEMRMLNELQSVALTAQIPSEGVKMATVVLTIGPIVFLFPFLQRYFVKGLVIGSVKG